MSKFFLIVSRIAIALLLIFELLNWLGVLRYTLDFTWFGLFITGLVVWAFFEVVNILLNKKCQSKLPGLIFFLAVLGVYYDALGDILKFYSRYSWYDQLGHFIGGFIVSLVVLSVILSLNKAGKIKLGARGISFFTLTTASFAGILYELEEYFEDVLTGSNRLGSGTDTANDLFLGVMGALVVVLIFFTIRYKKSNKTMKP